MTTSSAARPMKPPLKPRRDFRLAACLLAASGLAALGHQVLWTRRLMDLLGASAESSTRVFVCFFLGLALGAAIMASALPGIRRPWRCLGWIELGIGLTSVPILLLPDWSAWVWQGLGPESLLSGLGSAVKTGLSLALVLPPTVLMGMTLPVAVAAACPTGASQARDAVWLYAVNTLGGGPVWRSWRVLRSGSLAFPVRCWCWLE